MNETGGAKAWVLAFIVAAGTGFGALVGVGCAIGANACPFSREELTTTSGKEIWTARCAACHGTRGEGTRNAPSLTAGSPARLTRAQLEEKIARGRPFYGMPRFKGVLSPEQIGAVARHVVGLREAS